MSEDIKHDVDDVQLVEALRALTSKDEDTRQEAFASISVPVQAQVDSNSLAGIVLQKETLAAGASATYPVAPQETVECIVVPFGGAAPVTQITSSVLNVPVYPYMASFEMPEAYINEARFGLVQEGMRILAKAFIDKENTDVLSVVASAVGAGQTVTQTSGETGYGTFSLGLLEKALVRFAENGYTPDTCILSPGCASDFRSLLTNANIPTEVKTSIWKGGSYFPAWGINFYTHRALTNASVYLFDSTKFGVMPIKKEIETREDPAAASEFMLKVNAQKICGIAAIDKLAMVKMTTNKS